MRMCGIAAVLAFATSASSFASSIDLTGDWILEANEVTYPYFHWTATLTITQGAGSPDHLPLSGSFYWVGTSPTESGSNTGYEDFQDGANGTSSYFNSLTNTFHVSGYRLRDLVSTIPGWTLTLGTYTADVSPDGNSLLNGSWPGSYPGIWEAHRVIPEPATLSVLAFGALAVLRRRR